MALRRKKFVYNAATNSFEKHVRSARAWAVRVFGFLASSTVTGILIAALIFRFGQSPAEKRMQGNLREQRERYAYLQRQLSTLDQDLRHIEERDNGVYRAIFEAEPLPDSIRYGAAYAPRDTARFRFTSTEALLTSVERGVRGLQNRLVVQAHSLDTLQKLVEAKEEMLASIPAIQPVSNKDLSRIASGFGYRIDPVYKTPKMHAGLDFAAPLGTPIYATANGRVAQVAFEETGYGTHVILDHGYGYRTLYGHMIKAKARPGEKVTRGEVIGWVGSTGKSTGPHCHYEVVRGGEKTDPVHFFFNDLGPADYERLVKIAAASGQSFD